MSPPRTGAPEAPSDSVDDLLLPRPKSLRQRCGPSKKRQQRCQRQQYQAYGAQRPRETVTHWASLLTRKEPLVAQNTRRLRRGCRLRFLFGAHFRAPRLYAPEGGRDSTHILLYRNRERDSVSLPEIVSEGRNTQVEERLERGSGETNAYGLKNEHGDDGRDNQN